ncbi:hypothetical protein N9L94_01235 [Robiginitalea sp.]|nr:hypothetical protein [Robiginitalea sp.]
MKKNANQLHDELTKKLITENYVDLKPINKIEATPKADFEKKFFDYINEAGEKSLNPIVNNEDKVNTKEQEEKIKSDDKLKFEMETKEAGSFKVSNEVENIASHNYDYSPKVDNINNVNAQEMLTGVYCEIKNDPNLTLEEAQAKAIANLAKDSLHYVKEGQFGVEGLGYQEQKVQENDGETYGGSGYSEKLKDGGESWSVVKEGIKNILKENFAGIATSGNPNSFASMSGKVINDMLAEEGLKEIPNSLDNFVNELNDEKDMPMDENDVDEARDKAIKSSQEKAGMDEEARPDYPDIDGDGDTKEPMAKAAKDKEKKKKVKKESIDSRLAEIGKEAEAVKLEAQLDFLHDHIQEKVDRVNSINEDDNLKELIDKSKMKQMQREIKDLERKKLKMEKIYEKSCGKKYSKKEMVDETEEVDESFDSVVDDIMDQGKSREDAEKIAGAINAKHVGNYRS